MVGYNVGPAVAYIGAMARGREYGMQMLGIQAERQAQRDRYAYQSALMTQEHLQALERDDARFLNERDLWDRRQAGESAERELARIANERMAAFTAQQQELRDYRLADMEAARAEQLGSLDIRKLRESHRLDLGQIGYQADIQMERDYRLAGLQAEEQVRGAGIQEERDWRLAGIQEGEDYRRQGIDLDKLARVQGFQAGMAGFEAEKQEESQIRQAELQAELNRRAVLGRMAEEEFMRRGQRGYLDTAHQYELEEIKAKRQGEADQQILKGLASGDLVIDPEVQADIREIQNSARRVFNSQELSPEQKREFNQWAEDRVVNLRRNFARSPSPEEKWNTLEGQRQRAIMTLPPEVRNEPWQLDSKTGTLEMPRGYKKSFLPITAEEFEAFRKNLPPEFRGIGARRDAQGNVILDPDGVKLAIEKMRLEGAQQKQEAQIKAGREKQEAQFQSRREIEEERAKSLQSRRETLTRDQYEDSKARAEKDALTAIVALDPDIEPPGEKTFWGNQAVRKMTAREKLDAAKTQTETLYGKSYEAFMAKGKSKEQGQDPARPRSKEEYDALPSGTLFIAPDGSLRRKP